jgi:AcrR family transcriptional regulator
MTKSLKSRKQEFARDSIYDAAIDLFVHKGFQETTVEDVAQAAGVSRRSFFRYFTTKDHLLGHNMVRLGEVLVSAVAASPAESSPIQVVRDAVSAGLRFGTSHPRTRQVIEITARNPSARRAHRSRRVDIEDRLSEAFAARTRNETKDHVRPKMLAILTLTVVDLATVSWFKGESEDYSKAADDVFALLFQVLGEPTYTHTSQLPQTPKLMSLAARKRKPMAAR